MRFRHLLILLLFGVGVVLASVESGNLAATVEGNMTENLTESSTRNVAANVAVVTNMESLTGYMMESSTAMEKSSGLNALESMEINAPESLPNTAITMAANPQDYDKLVQYVNILSFSYCKGLKPGKLGSTKSKCASSKCKDKKYKDIEVLKVFDFNHFGSVGAGFKGIDHTNKKIYLAFRGTSTGRDWAADFNVPLKTYRPLPNILKNDKFKCDGCLVHRGFYNFVEEFCIQLIKSVHELKETYPDYQVVTLGHSLGGAFALLSGIEFKLMGYDTLVLTYASPKVGNKPLIKYLNKLFDTDTVAQQISNSENFTNGYIRVVHINDIVAMLPPRELGYHHGGVEYLINSKKLPHLPKGLERRGTDYFYDNDDDSVTKKLKRITKTMKQVFTNFEHIHYFITISGCQ